ncbi:MAG: DUF4114 domain-containing protein [Cyanobacteria bacterium J06554_6]
MSWEQGGSGSLGLGGSGQTLSQLLPTTDVQLRSIETVCASGQPIDGDEGGSLAQAQLTSISDRWSGADVTGPLQSLAVSCIAGLGSPDDGTAALLPPELEGVLKRGWDKAIDQILTALSHDGAEITAQFGLQAIPQLQSLVAMPLRIEPVPIAALAARGAFAARTNTIYIAEEWAAGQSVDAIATVLIEEIGHWLDSQISPIDTPGDEGALLVALVQQQLTPERAAVLAQEDDNATFVWQGQTLAIEKSELEGVFTVGSTGAVTVNFLHDNGAYEGELGIFDLTGMAALEPGSTAYIQEASRRALSNSAEGYVVISDVTQGAQRSGDLGERDWNSGPTADSRTLSLTTGTQFALMLVPDGTIQSVFDDPGSGGAQRPLFSIAAANPRNAVHLAQVGSTVFAMEDIRFDRGSDRDFNDLVFGLEGASGIFLPLSEVVATKKDWSDTLIGQSFAALAPVSNPSTSVISAILSSFDRDGRLLSDAAGLMSTDIAADVPSITVGGSIFFAGYEQATAINQNPVLRAFDSVTGIELWARDDYETGGPDGRAIGLASTGGNLYVIFTVDGADGDTSQDLRRAATDAETAWLRSYGSGGGAKVSVLGLIDPANGDLLQTAYLTAILSNGNTNSLLVTDVATNDDGNLVVSAESFFSPRGTDGAALTQVTTSSSPFAYTVELTPDLKRVVSTSAVGWI